MNRLAMLTMVAMLGASACSDTPTTPDVPDPVTIVLPPDAPGVLVAKGAITHDFSVGSSGDVEAQLTLLGDGTQTVSFALGTWDSGTRVCTLTFVRDDAKQGTIFNGTAGRAGPLCVRVADVGLLTDPVEYRIRVVYPGTR